MRIQKLFGHTSNGTTHEFVLPPEQEKIFCLWTFNEDDYCWDTQCKHGLAATKGRLLDSAFKYCIFCGRKLLKRKD